MNVEVATGLSVPVIIVGGLLFTIWKDKKNGKKKVK